MKYKEKNKFIIILLCAVALILVAVYLGGCIFFKTHFCPNTYINDFDCSFMTIEETKDLFDKKVKSYAIAVKTRNGGVEKISASDIDMSYKNDGSLQAILEGQNRSSWFMLSEKHNSLGENYLIDTEKLKVSIDELSCMKNMAPPVDAMISQIDDTFEIIPEVKGTKLNKDKSYALIETAIKEGKTSVDLENCYINPKVFSTDKELKKQCETLNRIKDVVITYDFDDRTECIDIEKIKTFLTDNEIDENKVAAYVKKLAQKYDTKGKERTFLTYDDRKKKISGGDYGWVIDQKKETNELIEMILNATTDIRNPVYEQQAQSRNSNDIGYTYLEIDQKNQVVVLYVDGQPVIQSDVKLYGKIPVGCYSIHESKKINEIGENEEEVEYFVPFGTNLAIFGKDTDESDRNSEQSSDETEDDAIRGEQSSEEDAGINIPLNRYCSVPVDIAMQIYGQVEQGLPVIVY